MELVFREARDEDWSIVAEMEKSAAGSKFYFPYTEELKVRDYIEKSHVFISFLDEEPVGTISYELKTPNHAELNGLIVHPSQRGNGFAGKALEFIMDRLEGKKVTTVVHPENNIGIKLYLEAGMTIKAWEDNYYGDGEPRLVMTKTP